MKTNLFITTAEQKILEFLCRNPYQSFYGAQIALRSLLSKGGTNQILRKMARQGLLKTEKKGRMIFYQVDSRSPVIKQFKILRNVARADEIIKKIKPFCERIILFGSSANGEDTQESDIDIFVVAKDKERMMTLIPDFKENKKIQLVVKTPQEYINLDKKGPVFSQEIKKGIVLWEKE